MPLATSHTPIQGDGASPIGVAVIAGAGDGIGLSLARQCLQAGMLVNVVSRSLERLEKRIAVLEHRPGCLASHECDLRSELDVNALFDRIEAAYGPPDLVVFNAGAQYRKPFLDTSGEMFEKVWRLGCHAGFLVGRAAAKSMTQRGSGTIIFSGATASLRGGSEFAAFASAKFALRAVAQSMARELGPKGIHVASVIIDGVIDTPRMRQLFPDAPDASKADKRLQPDEIAEAYLSLHRQQRSAWSHEIDLRPWCETF